MRGVSERMRLRRMSAYRSSRVAANSASISLNEGLTGVRVFAQTSLPGFAVAGRFTGLYTYDVLVYGPSRFARICSEAHRVHLLCAPSVGPGYMATAATGDPRVKAGGLALDGVAVAIDAAIADALRAGHDGAQFGDRQAALPAHADLLADRLDLRVDQHRVGHRARGGIGRRPFAGHAEHEQPQRHIHLWGGEADAWRILHRLHHVRDEAADLRRPRIGHGIAAADQDGMTHAGDFQDGHGVFR